MKARCPVCDQLVGISSTGKRIGAWGSACWFLVDMHANRGAVCSGSGRRI